MTVNAALSFPFSVFESHVNIHERYLFLKAVTMAKSVLSPLISIPLLLLGFRSPTIATLANLLAFPSPSAFARQFKQQYGLTPTEYQRRKE